MKKSLLLVCAVGLFGCSTASVRVMPGNEKNKIVARDIKKEGAEEAANEAAQEYCEKQNKSLVVLSYNTQYTGDMDESTRKNVKNASTAAMMVGGFNSPISKAGMAGHVMTNDKDYVSEIIFKCKGA